MFYLVERTYDVGLDEAYDEKIVERFGDILGVLDYIKQNKPSKTYKEYAIFVEVVPEIRLNVEGVDTKAEVFLKSEPSWVTRR